MKAILISIKPKYVAKILNGEKTIEIRKTMPKCDMPIDVYIYCTKDKDLLHKNCVDIYWVEDKDFQAKNKKFGIKTQPYLNGKVLAKFTLNKVEEIGGDSIYQTIRAHYLLKNMCLKENELFDYLNGQVGYALKISNLVIFDRPKEISEFYKVGFDKALKESLESEPYPICSVRIEKQYQLTKAPQSWCYIESED